VALAEQALGRTALAAAAAPVAGPRLQVAVSIAPELAGARPPAGTLFVFARAVGGPPLPLAVAKLDPAGLPLEVTLDDSMAMAAGMTLSSAKQVEVIARISASGQVRAQPGDLEGSSGPLALTEGAQQLSLRIDRRL
jgi:cytochrome c-type biogenesis protein CcmH